MQASPQANWAAVGAGCLGEAKEFCLSEVWASGEVEAFYSSEVEVFSLAVEVKRPASGVPLGARHAGGL